jgi:hypothetical protein
LTGCEFGVVVVVPLTGCEFGGVVVVVVPETDCVVPETDCVVLEAGCEFGRVVVVVVEVLDGFTTLELLFPEVPPTAPPTTAPMTRRATKAISNLPLVVLQGDRALVASACGTPPSSSRLTELYSLAPRTLVAPASSGSPALEGKDGPTPVADGVRGGGARD